MRSYLSRIAPPAIVALAFLLGACRETKISTYTAPKDPPPPAPAATPETNPHAGNLPEGHPPIAGQNNPSTPTTPTSPSAQSGAMPAAPVAPGAPAGIAAQSPLAWTAPSAWIAKPVSTMRLGSYNLPGSDAADQPADLSISALGPAMGVGEGLLSNINRWRGQVQLAPITTAEHAAQSTTFTANNLTFVVVEFSGTAPAPAATNATPATRILAAIVPSSSATYFFKITGPDPVVARHKADFLEFLKTVRQR